MTVDAQAERPEHWSEDPVAWVRWILSVAETEGRWHLAGSDIAAIAALAARLEAAESQRDEALVALNIAYTNRDARLEAAETALERIARGHSVNPPDDRPYEAATLSAIARAALAAGRGEHG